VTEKLKVKYRNCSQLIPYINNSRTHDDLQVSQVAASISEFGFTNPILIDENDNIIAGHGRLMAAQKLQLEEIPTITLKGLTEAQRKAYVIADNQLALNAGWNLDTLKVEIERLTELDFDIDLLGFDDDMLAGLMEDEPAEGLTDEDDVPEVEDDPVTVEGDVWILGNHRLMCGDSTSIDAVDKLMAGNKADMVFTDPPYGMKLDADFSDMDSKFKGSTGGNKYENVIGDHNDFDPALINAVFASFSYCKEIFMWGADYYAEHLFSKNNGSWVVWDKRLDDSADKMYGSTFELCWSKAKHKRIMARVKWAGIFGMEKEHDKKRAHPTQKPVALVDWFFDYFSLQKAKSVVDLYGGSGATLLSAEKNAKHCYMMELDPKYCDVIIKRWQDFTGQEAIIETTGDKFNDMYINGRQSNFADVDVSQLEAAV